MRGKPRAAMCGAAAVASLLVLPISAPAAAPLEVLRKCAADAPQGARGIEQLAAACPDISNALQALGIDRLLTSGWRGNLSPQALQDLADLSSRYDAQQFHPGPNIASLNGIVEAVNGKPPPTNTWWQKLNDWLRDWLARHDLSLSGWLNGMAKSPSIWKFAGFLCAALILAAAAAVIVNELRAAGVCKRRRRSRVARRNPDAAMPASAAAMAPAADSVTELLRQLVARLTETGRLGNERSLTHRELIARSRLDTEEQRNVLRGVAVTAERVMYGEGASADPPSALIARARTLLAQLNEGPA